MKPSDYAKAAGIAILVLTVDILIAIGVVYFYAAFLNPGHPKDYYTGAAGISVARWSTRIVGTALIFGTAWLCARRNANRNAYAFAITLTAFYALLDGVSVGFVGVFTGGFALTIGLKLIGALVGALLAVRARAVMVERQELA